MTVRKKTSDSPLTIVDFDETDKTTIRADLGITALLALKADTVAAPSVVTANFNVGTSHDGAVVPITANVDATLLASAALPGTFNFALRNDANVTGKIVAGTGAVVIVDGVSVAAVAVTGDGGHLIVSGCSVTNKFHVSVSGGSSTAVTGL